LERYTARGVLCQECASYGKRNTSYEKKQRVHATKQGVKFGRPFGNSKYRMQQKYLCGEHAMIFFQRKQTCNAKE
jgi:hypothetical protein